MARVKLLSARTLLQAFPGGKGLLLLAACAIWAVPSRCEAQLFGQRIGGQPVQFRARESEAQSNRPAAAAKSKSTPERVSAKSQPSSRVPKSRVLRAAWEDPLDPLPAKTVPSIRTDDLPPATKPVPLAADETTEQVQEWITPTNAGEHHSQSCNHCDGHGCGSCIGADWSRFSFFAGIAGFSNAPNFIGTTDVALDRRGSGSFGFQEGFNWGHQLPGLFCGEIGMQFGLRAIQANLNGTEFTTDSRNQIFLTGGFFRRVDLGLQAGLVVDYLSDRWYSDIDLVQTRGELSYLFTPEHEFGFRFSAGQQTSTNPGTIRDNAGALAAINPTFAAQSQYRFFYRQRVGLDRQTLIDAQLGWTDEDQFILGANSLTPLAPQLGLQSGFSYVIPGKTYTVAEHQSEVWNVGLMLVWTPGRCVGGRQDYYQPLIDVADNGSFLISRRR